MTSTRRIESPGAREVAVEQCGRAPAGSARDVVAVEEPMEVRVNGAPFAVMIRTPGADRDLAAGFLLALSNICDRGRSS